MDIPACIVHFRFILSLQSKYRNENVKSNAMGINYCIAAVAIRGQRAQTVVPFTEEHWDFSAGEYTRKNIRVSRPFTSGKALPS